MARTTPHDHVVGGHPPTDGEPLYQRVATALLGELRTGTVPPGERLPGERQLAEHFGVSRETVRQALQVLRRDGLVATDRRGSHAALPGEPVEAPAAAGFPLGARRAGRDTAARPPSPGRSRRRGTRSRWGSPRAGRP